MTENRQNCDETNINPSEGSRNRSLERAGSMDSLIVHFPSPERMKQLQTEELKRATRRSETKNNNLKQRAKRNHLKQQAMRDHLKQWAKLDPSPSAAECRQMHLEYYFSSIDCLKKGKENKGSSMNVQPSVSQERPFAQFGCFKKSNEKNYDNE